MKALQNAQLRSWVRAIVWVPFMPVCATAHTEPRARARPGARRGGGIKVLKCMGALLSTAQTTHQPMHMLERVNVTRDSVPGMRRACETVPCPMVECLPSFIHWIVDA